MELRIDPGLPLAVYEQIRAQVTRLVAGGRVTPGARLPTIRQLAADLRLAKGTVERAYALLESDGVIITRGRAGTFVVVPDGMGGTGAAPDLGDLHDAADAMALVAHQLGVGPAVAAEVLTQALSRLDLGDRGP